MPGRKRPSSPKLSKGVDSTDENVENGLAKRISIIRTRVYSQQSSPGITILEEGGGSPTDLSYFEEDDNEFIYNGESESGSDQEETLSKHSSEYEYAERISVGSETTTDKSILAFNNSDETSHQSELEEYFEGNTTTTSLLGEDERYARLLQQQEIALARSYMQDGFLGHEFVEAMEAESEASLDMSYEALLELQENIGEVKKRGLSMTSINSLPRVKYNDNNNLSMVGKDCIVCMTGYNGGEELLRLPCMHHFHDKCVTGWLLVKNSCPVCREIVPEIVDLSNTFYQDSNEKFNNHQ